MVPAARLPCEVFFPDGVSAVNLPSSVLYRVSSIALTRAPSSNTLLNLTTSPFGPAISTPWTNGLLASPALRLPTSYKSQTLVFSALLYMHSVSGITATLAGKAPSPRLGVYSSLACLNSSPGSGSLCSRTSAPPVLFFGVVDEAFCSTWTTPPLFPGVLVVGGTLIHPVRRCGLRWIPQLRS